MFSLYRMHYFEKNTLVKYAKSYTQNKGNRAKKNN